MTETTDMPAVGQRIQAWLDFDRAGRPGEPSKTLSCSYEKAPLLRADLEAVAALIAGLGQPGIEWTVARHGLHSIEYGTDARPEGYVRNEVREEIECGQPASVAFRIVGKWQHEDPEAQRHADAIDTVMAAMKAAAR